MKMWRMSRGPWLSVAAAASCCLGISLPLLAAAGNPLPEGVGREVTMLDAAIRAAAVGWAAFLLIFGRRFERATTGTFFLLACLGVAWPMLASASYAAALMAAFLAYAAAMLVYAFVPRLAMAVACAWPLAGLYAAHVYFSGSFSPRWLLFLGLLVAGALLGALLPKAALAVVSSGIGTLLLWLASPLDFGFWSVAMIFAGGVLWQAAIAPVFFPVIPASLAVDNNSLSAKRLRWFGALKTGAVVLAAGAFAAALLAPRIEPASASQKARLEALSKQGALLRPGLLFSPADAFYLGGRPIETALVGGSGTPWDRLALPLLGHSPAASVHRLRAVKEPAELETMRRAAAITSKAFETIAPMIRPGVNEKEVERAILNSFQKNGANGIAFPCVVGSGRNATLPHYMANDAVMRDGFAVVDIGCALNGYASDMTRTFSVNDRYTEAQKKLLELLVQAGDAARARLKAGASYAALDKAARDVITKAGFGPYFNHGLGHPVGLDVHDPYQDKLMAGMVVTIEPGIYIPAGSPVDRPYWDLGARIEDSYIVTANGFEEITSFPKIPPERTALNAGK